MDPLDPLNTVDPTAPHTSSISGNRYLVKKPEEKVISGNVVKVLREEELEEGFEGAWWALVGMDMNDSPLLFPGQKSCLIHLQGQRLHPKAGKLLLSPSPDSITLARLISLSTASLAQLPATEVGQIHSAKIYSEVIPADDPSEAVDGTMFLRVLTEVFPYGEHVLGYYVYTQLGTFPTVTAARSMVSYSQPLIETVTKLELLQYRTGVPAEPSTSPAPVTEATAVLVESGQPTGEQG